VPSATGLLPIIGVVDAVLSNRTGSSTSSSHHLILNCSAAYNISISEGHVHMSIVYIEQ
jgi:hypothetical protein